MSIDATATSISSARPEAVINEINAFLKTPLSAKQVVDVYDRWAKTYDADLKRSGVGFGITHQMAEAFARLMPPQPGLRILDIACGTGLVGERLHRLGYPPIDGLDCSSGMLEVARQKGCYGELFCEMVGEEPVKCAQRRTYDALVTSGSLLPNHLTASCLRHLAALVKPGGLFGIAMRSEFQMQPELLKLQAEGLWDVALFEERQNSYGSKPGMIYVMKVK